MPKLPEGTKPFDRTELQKCALCDKGMVHNNDLTFYEIRIGQVMIDYGSVRQIAGLEMAMGPGAEAIAGILAPTSRVGVRLPEDRVLICQSCMLGSPDGMAIVALIPE